MSWLWVMLAILLEVSGTTCMKLSDQFRHLTPSVLMFVFYALSLASLTMALGEINISVVYAIWSGMGTALIAAVGFIYFRETPTPQKIFSLALIIVGIVGLQLAGVGHSAEPTSPQVSTSTKTHDAESSSADACSCTSAEPKHVDPPTASRSVEKLAVR